MQERISIHVCSKDRASELCILLHSLRTQTYKAWDLVLLDDAYGTPLANFKFIIDILDRLKLAGHGVQLIRENQSYGVCKARNKLLELDPWPENPYVFRVDDDCVLEPDFLARAINIIVNHKDCGIVGGVTPTFSGPDIIRETKFVKPIINKIELDQEGKLIKYADDCGLLYDKILTLPTHNFRSMALIKRKVFQDVGGYELGLTNVGFREEAFFSLKALMQGYKILVSTGLVCWHAHCLSGGCRYNNYAALVHQDQLTFEKFLKNNKEKLSEVLK